MALIYPTEEVDSEVTKDLVKKNINPIELNMGIKRVKKVNKGGLLMELDSQGDYEKLEMELQVNENLKDRLTVKKSEKTNPKMIIYNISPDINDEELVYCIKTQNNIDESADIKVDFKMRSERGHNTIISCHHTVFNSIIKKGKININWERYNVREFIRPVQYFKCYQFGYVAKYCRGLSTCYNCGINEHKDSECKETSLCTNCDLHNKRFGTKFPISHDLKNKDCGVRILELNQLRSRINYGPD